MYVNLVLGKTAFPVNLAVLRTTLFHFTAFHFNKNWSDRNSGAASSIMYTHRPNFVHANLNEARYQNQVPILDGEHYFLHELKWET